MAVNLDQPTPIECLKRGLPIAQARHMRPEDLTEADTRRLLDADLQRYEIATLYEFSPGPFYQLLAGWGLFSRQYPVHKDKPKRDLKLVPDGQPSRGRGRPAGSGKRALVEGAHQEPTKEEPPDVQSMKRFAPDERGLHRRGSFIVVDKRHVSVSVRTMRSGPDIYLRADIQLVAEIFVHPDGQTIVVRPNSEGYYFPTAGGNSLTRRASAKCVTEYLKELEVPMPAYYKSEWDDRMRAWVGKLVAP